jgi:hypothetical protein
MTDNQLHSLQISGDTDKEHLHGVQLISGPYFNISNLFTTCYITQLT